MKSSAAISLFVRPWAASSATRCSVSVSSLVGRPPAADPPELGAGPSAQRRRAELLEDGERLLERLAGGLLLLRLPAHDAQAEQGAGALEGKRESSAPRGALERHEGASTFTFGGEQEAPAAQRARHRQGLPTGRRSPRTVEVRAPACRAPLRRPASRSRPPRRVVGSYPAASELSGKLAEVDPKPPRHSEHELEAAEHAEGEDRRILCPNLLGVLLSPSRRRRGHFDRPRSSLGERPKPSREAA